MVSTECHRRHSSLAVRYASQYAKICLIDSVEIMAVLLLPARVIRVATPCKCDPQSIPTATGI